MAIWLRQSTASQEVCLGPFVDATDGKTAETGLTIANTDIVLWKMGATSTGTKNSGGGTHMAGGLYSAVLDATDTNTLGGLVALVNVAGALPVRHEFQVLPSNIYDSLIAGSDLLDVSVTQWLGTAVGAGTAGVPNVDVTRISNAAVSTSSAQLGVNVVNFGGSAGTFSSGRPEVNTTHAAGTAWGSGAITAGSIASNAITSAKIATDAIGAAQIADGAIDAGAIASDAITAAKIADGAIDAATFATGAITAAAIAANAIGASELAADAVTEIQNGLATAAALATVDGVVDAIKAVTDNLPDSGALTSIAQEASLITASDAASAVADQAVTACTAVPAANASIGVVLGYILAELRNLKTVNRTTGVETLKQDDGATNIGTRTVTDDGTTFTRPELA